MTDQYGRRINYMRVSITGRCNLRCLYCMPRGKRQVAHGDILSYEELLRVCRLAVELGVNRFKVTGGEPLVRMGCVDFMARLKGLEGVEQVTLTTNGLELDGYLEDLAAIGVDGINISLDTLDRERYAELTGLKGPPPALEDVAARCAGLDIPTKINAVLLRQTAGDIPALAALAARLPVDVRFIELMPVGPGNGMEGVTASQALLALQDCWPGLHPTGERRGNGPARYYAAPGLQGRIGLITAMSDGFCSSCNRVRLTSTGGLKPCLCHEAGVDLRQLLRSGGTDDEIARTMAACIAGKPPAHCFDDPEAMTEEQTMDRIGG